MYFTDDVSLNYPKSPQDFDFDETLFYPRHLRGTYISLPENWQVPTNWESFNQSTAPYVFLRSVEDKYTGSANTPMFIVRNGYQVLPDYYPVVYEDGHVGIVSKKEAIELWKSAGVWNGAE